MDISVIICSYKPDIGILNNVLDVLSKQTLDRDRWELIIVDNNSPEKIEHNINLSWHKKGRIVIEKKQGLALARIRGVKEAVSECIVFIDDDNVAGLDYLEKSLLIFSNYATIGVFGGKALPHYLKHFPADWIKNYTGLLGCRDLGEQEIVSNIEKNELREYPSFSPIGTGMCIRKEVFLTYLNEIDSNNFRKDLGRKGNSLTSGEDNDIVITAFKNGWQVGYFPQLQIEHIIPEKRTSIDYLCKMNFAQNKSWIQLLLFHGICPFKRISRWSVLLRKIKAYFSYQPWKIKENLVKWKGVCGQYEGLVG